GSGQPGCARPRAGRADTPSRRRRIGERLIGPRRWMREARQQDSIRESVSFHLAHEGFDRCGRPLDRAANAAADRLLNHLAWWAAALRSARVASPYPTG